MVDDEELACVHQEVHLVLEFLGPRKQGGKKHDTRGGEDTGRGGTVDNTNTAQQSRRGTALAQDTNAVQPISFLSASLPSNFAKVRNFVGSILRPQNQKKIIPNNQHK